MNLAKQSNELDTILSLIEQESEAAEAGLGPITTGDNNELAVRTAQVFHQVTTRLAQLEDQAALAYKLSLWIVCRDKLWRNIHIPLIDEHGEFVKNSDGTDAYLIFANFREWFDHITVAKSPATKSALWNGVTRFYAAIDAGRVGNKPDGTPWQVEDVITMSERNFSVMASLAHRKDEEAKIEDLADYMLPAMSTTQEKLIEQARSKGDSGSRVSAVKAYRAFDEDGNQVIVMKPTERQYKSLDVALGKRVEWESVEMAALAAMFTGKGDTEDDEPQFADLFGSL